MSTVLQVDSEDASFLFSERLDNPAQLSLIALYDQSSLADQVVRFRDLKQLISNRLQTTPVLRQQLKRIPADMDYPYWVDDMRFDIDYHVRHLALPQPGDWRQFCIQVARLHSRPLDTRRPLWELYVIEGLNAVEGLPEGSFAIYFKVHHCAMDQLTAMEFLESLHENKPNPGQHKDVVPRVRHARVRAPTTTEMTVYGLWGNSQRMLNLARPPWHHYRRLGRALRRVLQQRRHSPERDLNSSTTAHFSFVANSPRVFEGLSVPRRVFEQLEKQVPESSLEHALTLICTEVTRRYLQRIGSGSPEKMAARLHLPARHAGAHALAGSTHALREVEAYCGIESLLERLTAIACTVEENPPLHLEQQALLLRARYEGLPAPLNQFLARHVQRRGRIEDGRERLGVELLRGPADTLYLLGARLSGVTSLSPLPDDCSLVFSATTYHGRVHLSFTSESDSLPEPRLLKKEMENLIAELQALTR